METWERRCVDEIVTGGMHMVTQFGKFCRKLRIDKDELLFDMAKKLGVSSAFLSGVENGRKKPPIAWKEELVDLYDLNPSEEEELERLIFEARNTDSIDMSKFTSEEKNMMLQFARKINTVNRKKFKDLMND